MSTKPAHKGRRRGHTLLEMVLSLVLLGIVMASLSSAVIFASSANPDEGGPEATLAEDSRALVQIAEDLSMARYVIEQTGKAVTIVVSDRNDDGNPDRIRYAWSGTSGDPLTYRFNDNQPVNLLDSVAVFSLGYTAQTISKTLPPAVYRSDEKLIDSYTSLTLPYDDSVSSTNWYGQVFSPTLSSIALGYYPTMLKIIASGTATTDGEVLVEFRDWDGGGLGDTPYASSTVLESAVGTTYRWYDIPFEGSALIDSEQTVASVFRYASGTGTVLKIVESNAGSNQLESYDSGASWALDSGQTFYFELYATELLPDTIQYTVNREHLSAIDIKLQSVADNRSPLSRKTLMLLAPPSLESFAETAFDSDPTPADLDADGTPEWAHSTGTFSDYSISSGLWVVDGELRFVPANLSAAEVITVTARMRSNDTLGPTLYGPYTVNSDGDMLPIAAQLRDDGAGGQELVIYNDTTTTNAFATISGLPAGLVDIGLTVVPDADLVYIEVNHEEVASLKLGRVTDPGTISQAVRLGSGGGVAEFGSAYIRVGGAYTVSSVPVNVVMNQKFGLSF